MELKNCTPVLFAEDAKKTRDFYVDILGFTVVADFGGMNFVFKEGFAVWQPMDVNIIPQTLGSENIFNNNATSRFELCFETTNIDEVYETLKKNGTKFLHEMNVELWGQRTIRFYDPDGHLIEAGETMPVFLKRIYEEENHDLAATAKRTYMEPEAVQHFLNEIS